MTTVLQLHAEAVQHVAHQGVLPHRPDQIHPLLQAEVRAELGPRGIAHAALGPQLFRGPQRQPLA